MLINRHVAPALAMLLLAAHGAVQAQTAPSAAPALSSDQATQTRAKLEAAIRNKPADPDGYVLLAAFLTAQKDVAAALDVLAAGVSAVPRSGALLIVSGRLLLVTQRPEEAATAFARAAELDPKSVPARVELGDLYRARLRQPEKALALYDAALAISPDNVEALAGRGEALMTLGRLDDGVAALTKAAAVMPPRAPVQLMLADALQRAGKPAAAMGAVDAALKLEPNYVDARIARGNLLRLAGKPAAARNEFGLALKQDQNSVAAMTGIGLAYQAEGSIDFAITYLREVIERDGNNIYALNAMAWIAAERKTQLSEALRWASRAVELAPDQPDVLDTLGWVLRQSGDAARAEIVLARSAAIRPTAETLTHLGMAQEDGGRKDAARISFEAALNLEPKYTAASEGLKRLR